MSYYQLTQLQLAGLSAALVIALIGYSLLKRRGDIPHATLLGVLIGVLAACFFTITYLTADRDLPRVAQVAVKLLRDLPTVLIICYACMMQARRYSLVRDESPALQRWFGRSWWVIAATFFGSGALEFLLRPPVLESDESLPSTILIADAVVLVPLAAYSALSCSVFARTLWRNRASYDLPRRLQNLCGGLALGGLTVLTLHTLTWRWFRVVVPEDRIDPIIEQLSTDQVVIISLVAVNLLVGLVSYSSEGRTEMLADRFEDFLRTFEGITEKLASASVSAEGMNLTHAAMTRATDEDLLNLDSEEKRLADSAFRAVLVTEGQRAPATERSRNLITREQLLALSGFYEREFADPVVIYEIRKTPHERLPDTLRGLLSHSRSMSGESGEHDFYAVVNLLLEIVDEGDRSRPQAMGTWAQLVYVALADAGLLSYGRDGETTSNGRPIQELVVDAYNLAKYEVENRRLEL